MSVSFADVWGGIAFTLHIIGYSMYAYGIFHEHTRPNAASWLMWLFGAAVEYYTYTGIDNSHWTTGALPLACLFGVFAIFIATLITELRSRLRGVTDTIYEGSDPKDYILIVVDLAAFALYQLTSEAVWANVIVTGSTFFTFLPIWKTTYRDPENESAAPWFIWSGAYAAMFMAVLAEGGREVVAQSFYPVFYFVMHIMVALLCFPQIRKLIAKVLRPASKISQKKYGPPIRIPNK